MKLKGLLLGVCLITLFGCHGSGQQLVTQPLVLESITNQVIVAGLSEFYVETEQLEIAVTAFINSPNLTTLETAQQAWFSTQYAWQKTEPYQFGPIESLRLGSKINYWPKNTSEINAVIIGSDILNEDYLGTVGAYKKGLPVIEFLLFAEGSNQTVELFTTDPNAERYKVYLEILADDLHSQALRLYSEWQSSGGNYQTTYVQDSSALEMLVNQIISNVETIKSKKLGKPMGKQNGGRIDIDMLESSESGNGFVNIQANLETLSQIFQATNDPERYRLGDYLYTQDYSTLQNNIITQITLIQTQISRIRENKSLKEAIQSEDTRLETLYEQFTELIRLLKVDLPTAINTTVHFNDTDGD